MIKKKIKKCQSKGCKSKNLTVHHKIPLSEGGPDLESNIIVLCKDCHNKVHGIKPRNKKYNTKTYNGYRK